MTDNEIIKALKCCAIKNDCKGCYFDTHEAEDICAREVVKNAFDLINRQQAENDMIKIENQSLRSAAISYKIHYNKARAEAVREFAEKVKEIKVKYSLPLFGLQTKDEIENYADDILIQIRDGIDNLVKEMVGDTE